MSIVWRKDRCWGAVGVGAHMLEGQSRGYSSLLYKKGGDLGEGGDTGMKKQGQIGLMFRKQN